MKIHYRRFERRRLLTVHANASRTANPPVDIKSFQVPRIKPDVGKPSGRSTVPIRVVLHSTEMAVGVIVMTSPLAA